MATKTIKIKKRGGGYRLQKVLILRSGKYKFIKNTNIKRMTLAKPKGTVRKVARRKYRRSKKGSSNSLIPKGIMRPLGAVAYGFVRGKLNATIKNSRIGQSFAGVQYADEIGLLGAAFLARKLGVAKNPIGGSLIRAAEAIEWSNIGEQLSMRGSITGNTGLIF